MSIKFKIPVTKEIIEMSLECGTHDEIEMIGQNCAIALSLKYIFPDVIVTGYHIYPFGINEYDETEDLKIDLPQCAKNFIKVFDSLSDTPNVRRCLPDFDFDIRISDEIISRINIEEVQAILKQPFHSPNNCKTYLMVPYSK